MENALDSRCFEFDAIDVVVAEIDSASLRELDDSLSDVRWNRLPPALVVPDIALSAANAGGEHLLRDAEALTDGFEVVHASNISAPVSSSQQRPYFDDRAAPLMIDDMASNPANRQSKVTEESIAESARLKAIWLSRSHPNQAEFGEQYSIGNQSAVGQFLNGKVPLSLKAARGFAEGLRCDIADFSVRLAAEAAKNLKFVAGEEDFVSVRRVDVQFSNGEGAWWITSTTVPRSPSVPISCASWVSRSGKQ